jgi:uncharacterized protein
LLISENGPFENRKQLKKCLDWGKAYARVAFIRISNAKNPLDNSAVHPKHTLLLKMAKDLKLTVNDLIANKEKNGFNKT